MSTLPVHDPVLACFKLNYTCIFFHNCQSFLCIYIGCVCVSVAAEESSSNTSLSQLLSLSPLWEALSCCLQQLDHSADQHAVLILQPAVEAFFLVHASGADQPVRRQPQSRSEQLAHISATADFAPLSPPPAPNTGHSLPSPHSDPSLT